MFRFGCAEFGAEMAAKANATPKAAKEAFGFDIIGACMLPVQVVIYNQGPHTFEINGLLFVL